MRGDGCAVIGGGSGSGGGVVVVVSISVSIPLNALSVRVCRSFEHI